MWACLQERPLALPHRGVPSQEKLASAGPTPPLWNQHSQAFPTCAFTYKLHFDQSKRHDGLSIHLSTQLPIYLAGVSNQESTRFLQNHQSPTHGPCKCQVFGRVWFIEPCQGCRPSGIEKFGIIEPGDNFSNLDDNQQHTIAYW